MVSATFRYLADHGRLPTFFLLLSMIVAFGFIRISTRLIRAQSKWWPGNVAVGGLHVHHVVFGLGFMLTGGFGLILLANQDQPVASCVLASVFGIGVALVLDEFALVLHLRDVYWSTEGRSSIDAVFVAIAATGLFLLGFHPLGLFSDFDLVGANRLELVLAVIVFFVFQCGLAAIVLLKGKVWTGLLGLFITPLLFVGALRLSRPSAPWAKRFYAHKPAKLTRAEQREHKLREPVIRQKIRLQEALAGKFGD